MSDNSRESIHVLIAIITLLFGFLGVVVPTFEEAFKVTISEYLIPLISGIIVTVVVVVTLNEYIRRG